MPWLFDALLGQIKGGLIVSCQALVDEPLHGSEIMARMAVAAEAGGAVAIRANSPQDVAAIRAVTKLPIIGLHKVDIPGYDVYITPRVVNAVALAAAGADIIAIDATARPHPEGETSAYIAAVRSATGLPLLADISTLAEAIAAAEAGADLVSTTMSGYTDETRNLTPALSLERRGSGAAGPDLELVRQAAAGLATRALMWDGRPCPSILSTPVIAEGRISTPEEARAALDAGAFAVVVGGAITRPQQITARFVRAITVSHKEF